MKNRAPSLFRWTERMQAPDADMPEFPDHAPDFLPDDAVADSLAPLLRHMGLDLFPGLHEMAAALADSQLHEERIDAKLEEIMKRLS